VVDLSINPMFCLGCIRYQPKSLDEELNEIKTSYEPEPRRRQKT
jgi:hypothetical protein